MLLGLWRRPFNYVFCALPSFYLSNKLDTNHDRLAPAQGLSGVGRRAHLTVAVIRCSEIVDTSGQHFRQDKDVEMKLLKGKVLYPQIKTFLFLVPSASPSQPCGRLTLNQPPDMRMPEPHLYLF